MASPLPSSANSDADAGEPSGALITEWSEQGSQNGAAAATHPLRVVTGHTVTLTLAA